MTATVAGMCVAAFAVFVVVPPSVDDFAPPAGLDGVWALGGLLTIVLGPVAAGLCAFFSLSALWTHRDTMPASSRRLHLVTLVLVAAVWVGFLSGWGSSVVAWWLD